MLSFLLMKQVTAQTKTVSGTVLDEQQKPVQGASVTAAGSASGTTTDGAGKFTLSVPTSITTIVVSTIGFTTQEVNIADRTSIAITLIAGPSESLSDVVVVGYGTSRRKDLTGSVSSISGNDLTRGAITNPLQQIAGRAAGVNVNQIGSEPGSRPNIRIRGITSLSGGNDPLVVVDGVQGNLDLLNQVPPNEIESVDILKDASSTAIYGSRGAPGVIIVTTKKGRAGRTVLEYNGFASADMLANKLDMLTAAEWSEQSTEWGVPASANKGANNDWYDLLTRTGYTQNHTISFGGGANGFNYRASLNAILQEGTVIKSNYRNYNGRIQATQKALDNKLTLTINLNSGITNTLGSPGGLGRAAFRSNLITAAYISRPTDPIYNPNGTFFNDPDVFEYLNPYAVAQTMTNEGKTNYFLTTFRTDLELVKGLTASWFGSWRKTDNNVGTYLPAASTDANAIRQNGVANINNNRTDEKLMDISLNYNKRTGAHNLAALVLYEWQKQDYQGNFTQAKGFINDLASFNALQFGDLSRVTAGDITSYRNDRTMISFLGRVNYSYLDRYLITASIRRDGSSVLGANNKWGNFPSVAVAWNIAGEPFMNSQKIFSGLKLKVGYGVTGNVQGLGPQNSIRLVGSSGTVFFGGSQITNFIISQNDNPDLTWETKKSTNVGLEFSILQGKLSGTIEAYTSETSNLLFNYTVPQPPYPFGSVFANVGRLKNDGIDVSLEYMAIESVNTSLRLAGNLSLMKNKVLELSGSISGIPLNTDYVGWGNNSFLIKGQPIGTFNIFRHSGKNGTNGETVADVDESGNIDQSARSADRVMMGSSLPTYTFAFAPTFTYKNFDISMLWRGSGGNKIYNGLRRSLSLFENIGKSNLLASAAEDGLFTSQFQSDLFLENGAYVRFDNLSVGYRFNLTNARYINALRVSATANNLAVFTDYSGLDPEVNVNGGNGSGGDGGIYPRSRSFGLGVNVIFK
jgi:TonB-dependent starch-binding outer membrane protein SusC